MGFRFKHAFIIGLILMGVFLAFPLLIQAISHEEHTTSSNNMVSKMQSWLRDEAREVPTGPDPLHHNSNPSQH